MGSAEGGSGTDRWWENPALSQADLRQYGESWSLAADAATATLLQSISQRLVSRTHEVENALKKVLEETDSVMTTISNTNNSFHQLANTQFIENRTYQDDADVARDEPDNQEKPPPTEEEVIARCRSAIAEGLALVSRSYERHEIHDSDSDDDDTPSSPLPVYALINPYEVKPLPHVIGTALFMEDDKLGLQESSSEDNSKVTLSPEETDSEDDLDMEDETEVSQKHKPIPESSSRLTDDSDSDWSDEEIQHPARTQTNKPQPPRMTSEDDDDDYDDEEDFFGPSSKSFKRVNNGPSLSSELNKKFQSTTATPHSASRIGGLDSDSDDGGLFGKRPDPLAAPPPKTAPSSTGVENVRTMPDPARIRPPATASLAKKTEGNLFASDSDDEGDLFSSRTQSSGKTKDAVKKESVKASSQATPRPSQTTSQKPLSGLFSSDGDDNEDGGLFPTKRSATQSVIEKDSDDDGDKEEPPPLPKANEKKVPVGGINIFGSAITSAIRRQQSSGSELSDEEGSDWGGSRKSSVSTPKITKPLNKQEPPIQAPASGKVAVAATGAAGGLFDDDDEEDLFGSIAKKNTTTSEKIQPKKDQSFPKVTPTTTQSAMPKKGIFSDDDEDDLFSIPSKSEQKPSKPPTAPAVGKSINSKASSKQDQIKATNPIKVPTGPQNPSSLFSSPSDDDDLFSGPVKTQVAKPQPAFSNEPPPILSSKVSSKDVPSDLFESPNSDDNLFSPKAVTSTAKDKKEMSQDDVKKSDKRESKSDSPALGSSVFNSQSDEDDDLFAEPKSKVEEPSEQKDISSKIGQTSAPSILDNSLTPNAGSDIFGSPEDDLFGEKFNSNSASVASQPKVIKSNQTNSGVNSIQKSQIDAASKISENKKVSLFGSPEDDDIFSVVTAKPKSDESKSNSVLKKSIFGDMSDEEDIFSIPSAPPKQNARDTLPTLASSGEDSQTKLPVSVKKEHLVTAPLAEDQKKEVTPGNEAMEAYSEVRKPPVGGVALFGGDELKAKINQRNSVISSKPEDVENLTSNTTEEITKRKERDELNSSKSFFDGESDDDDIFGISQTSRERTPSGILGRSSPPPLPSEDNKSSTLLGESDSSHSKVLQGSPTSENSLAVQNKEAKPSEEDKTEATSPEKKAKKPPVGGVSMFGGKGLGGSELFAKVNQRRSILGELPDSDSNIEETRTTEATKEETKPDESLSKSVMSTTLPTFTALPGLGSKTPQVKSGGQEISVSFDEPATATNTLESINKTRIKGSVKRRPPSRAHRRSAVEGNPHANREASPSSVTEPVSRDRSPEKEDSPTREVASQNVAPENSSSNSPPKVDPIFSSSENEDDLFGKTVITEERSEGNQKQESIKHDHSLQPQAITTPKDDADTEDDLFRKPRSASNTAKATSLVKPSTKSRSSSLFGEDDSDDEDLFGASKSSKSSSSKTAKPSVQQDTTRKQTKTPATQSLFGDEDDDIFSVPAAVGKNLTSVKKTFTSMPKSSLQATSEPFDDPLLGPRK